MVQKRLKQKNIIILGEDNNDEIKEVITDKLNYKINDMIDNEIIDKSGELWMKTKEFTKYEVSNFGRVRNIKTCNIMTIKQSKWNYYVCMSDNYNNVCNKTVSYLVAENFIDNPHNYTKVEHIDGNKSNNNSTNLKWVKQLKRNDIEEHIEDEEWKITTEDNNYEVSNKSNIRNKHTKQLMKTRNINGYSIVSIGDNNLLVHRIVAKAFIPNPENKPSVDHIDKNRSNNCVENLRWATSKEQCENRNHKGKQKTAQDRKIWRINIDNENDKVLYNNIEEVIDFIIEKNLTKTINRKNIFQNLKKQLLNHKVNGTTIKMCYGYKWKYEECKNLENEEWKNIKDIYPDAIDMKISNYGRVLNKLGDFVLGTLDGFGYKIIFLGIENKRHKVHRLVAELFIQNPENKKVVNHKDGNKLNNHVNNLEWNTHSENNQHAMDTNLNKCANQVKMIDINTKNETVYSSQKEASNKLNIGEYVLRKHIKNNTAYKNMMFNIINK